MRRWFRRRIDGIGYWLCKHGQYRIAIALWQALGMWNSEPAE